MREKKEIKIAVFKKGDVLGFSDLEYEDSSLYSCECVSERGEVIKFSKPVRVILKLVFTSFVSKRPSS